MEIRRSYDRLISTVGFPILVRWHIYIESGPWCLRLVLTYAVINVERIGQDNSFVAFPWQRWSEWSEAWYLPGILSTFGTNIAELWMDAGTNGIGLHHELNMHWSTLKTSGWINVKTSRHHILEPQDRQLSAPEKMLLLSNAIRQEVCFHPKKSNVLYYVLMYKKHHFETICLKIKYANKSSWYISIISQKGSRLRLWFYGL